MGSPLRNAGKPQVPSLSIEHSLVCDDVRLEIDNKETIVGVYSAGITVPTIPWPASVCLWLAVIWKGDGNLEIEIQILNPKRERVGESRGAANAIWQEHESSLTFRSISFQIKMEGSYEFQWRPTGGSWQMIRRLPISQSR